jgi:hypothetical protein
MWAVTGGESTLSCLLGTKLSIVIGRKSRRASKHKHFSNYLMASSRDMTETGERAVDIAEQK